MRMICFCGQETEQVHGALYCKNPECPEYMNIVEGTTLLVQPTEIEVGEDENGECTDDSIPFHDYNCAACAPKNL